MSDLRSPDPWRDTERGVPARLNGKAVASVLSPVLSALITFLALPRLSSGSAVAVAVADIVVGGICTVMAASAWRNIRSPSNGQYGLPWAVAGLVLALALILLGVVAVLLVIALDGLSSITW